MMGGQWTYVAVMYVVICVEYIMNNVITTGMIYVIICDLLALKSILHLALGSEY
jgi:hypothetical protein